jgi:membrane associated rhomboid family serine protease
MLTPGERIRVSVVTPAPRLYIGTYQARTDSTLQMQRGGSPLTIALSTVSRVEQSRGRRLSVAGGVLGFLVGGAGGAALGCLANRDDYGVFCGGQSDTKVVVGAALGGAAGAALGAVLFRRERWRPVEAASLQER